ncbi:MAG TPA: amidohydrolase family protein [Ramlibacter sp.]|nr:amidohydrolase family protein [Ramlibacter sp.]
MQPFLAEADCACCGPRPLSRRAFMGATAGLAALASGCASVTAGGADATLAGLLRAESDPKRRLLVRGATVLTMDRAVRDLPVGDVLVEGKRIAAVGPNLGATADVVVDGTGSILLPGFIDTHHHQYQTVLRSILADGALGLQKEDGPQNYISVMQQLFTPLYTPEDAYLSELVASWSQLHAGVTTTVDTSQVSLTPEHTDAMIAGLRDSGRRAVFAYSAGANLPTARYPQDIHRLRQQFFATDDQLLTLAMNAGPNPDIWRLARSVGAPIVSHIVGTRFGDLQRMGSMGLMGPDNEYIHCTQLNDATWKLIADTGGHVSIATPIEMQMRHGMPPLQKALDLGLKFSLSSDVECNMTADMFTLMRSTFTLQRALASERVLAGDAKAPKLLTTREVLEFATIEGARGARLERKVGSITPGKEADLVLLAADAINVMPLNNAPGAVVTLMDTSNVRHVFVAGRVKKWNGQLVGADVAGMRRRIEQARDALLARAKRQPDLFGSCCPT